MKIFWICKNYIFYFSKKSAPYLLQLMIYVMHFRLFAQKLIIYWQFWIIHAFFICLWNYCCYLFIQPLFRNWGSIYVFFFIYYGTLSVSYKRTLGGYGLKIIFSVGFHSFSNIYDWNIEQTVSFADPIHGITVHSRKSLSNAHKLPLHLQLSSVWADIIVIEISLCMSLLCKVLNLTHRVSNPITHQSALILPWTSGPESTQQ